MNYALHRTKDFEGSCYMEIGPGPFQGLYWQPGFVFVDEDDFVVTEPILARHFPAYFHWSTNNIPGGVGTLIVADWRTAAAALEQTRDPVESILELPNRNEHARNALQEARLPIACLLRDLADACEGFICARGSFFVVGP